MIPFIRGRFILCSLILAACSSVSEKQPLVDAATTPLDDLNLVRTKIPAVLLDAKNRPYELPSDLHCAYIAAEVRALDEALGPDLDVATQKPKPNLVKRSSDAIGKVAVDTVRKSAEEVVPFRSWVRKLTGAERHSKEVTSAIAAGTVRRAFLKGVFKARGCVPERGMESAPDGEPDVPDLEPFNVSERSE